MNPFFQLCIDNAATAVVTGKRELLVTNAAGQTVFIRGVIAPGFEANAVDILDAINKADPSKPLQISFNTPGGSVFEGKEIAAAIRNYPGKTIANIVSLCASAGTSIAIACDEVVMQKGAFFMVHNAQGAAFGDKTALRDTADLMEKVELSIVDDYTAKTGKTAEEIIAMMEAETWMSATEALENGFVDRIGGDGGTSNTWNLAAYANAPATLIAPSVASAVKTDSPPAVKNITTMTDDETAFMRSLIPHYQAVVDLSKLALALCETDSVIEFVEDVISDHAGDLELLETWTGVDEALEVDETINNSEPCMTQANRNRLALATAL